MPAREVVDGALVHLRRRAAADARVRHRHLRRAASCCRPTRARASAGCCVTGASPPPAVGALGGAAGSAPAARAAPGRTATSTAPRPRSIPASAAVTVGPHARRAARRAAATASAMRSPSRSATRRRRLRRRAARPGRRAAPAAWPSSSRGGEPVAVSAEGGVEVPAPSVVGRRSAPPACDSTIDRAAARVARCSFAGDDAAFDLELEAIGAPGRARPRARRRRKRGGMAGYEQPLPRDRQRHRRRRAHRRSTASASAATRGARPTGSASSSRARSRRGSATTSAVSLTAIRPAGKRDQAAEAVAASILERARTASPGARGASTRACRRPTTARAASVARAWSCGSSEDGWPRRAAGEIACGTSLDLGRLRLDCAFFRWRMEGREGFGRYDVLRRA